MKLHSKSLIVVLALCAAVFAGGLKGIGYSPFRYGQAPTGTGPTYAQEVEDLLMVKTICPRIKTFGIDKDYLKAIPAICESLSISYVVSGWFSLSYSATPAQARTDLAAFLKKADSLNYSKLEAVIYGYENVSYALYTPEANQVASVKAEINACKAAIRQYGVKLSHEENWDVWCRYPSLADSLDFVSVRIMPQSDLVKLSEAVSYVQACYDSVKARFPNKEVKVTSVGWSTYSSNESEQERFVDSLAAKAAFDYFLFEFADEYWKGGAEAKFGIFTDSRQPKLVVAPAETAMDFSWLFPADSTKLDGIVYNHSCFGYASGMSLPALEKNVGYWADTFKTIAKTVFLSSNDLTTANGILPDVFSAKGNVVGIIGGTDPASGVKIASINIGYSQFSSYGSYDSLNRLSSLDDIRHQIAISRSGRDSVFVAAQVGVFNRYYADSLLKYPEFVQDFDGCIFTANLTDLRNISKIDQYVDSMVVKLQTKLPGKKMVFVLNVWGLDGTKTDPDYLIYQAFKKARDKYGLALIIEDVSYLYSSAMTKPSEVYRLLMPWRFTSTVRYVLSGHDNKALFRATDRLITVGDVQGGAILAIFDLSGKIVRQAVIGQNSSFDLGSAKLPGGTFILKLNCRNESLTTKLLLKK